MTTSSSRRNVFDGNSILDAIQAVVFDLDGTLIDSVPDLATAVGRALKDHGLAAPPEAQVRDWVGNGSRKLLERALTDALEEKPGSELLDSVHQRFLYHYGQAPAVATRLYPGVKEGLEALKARGLHLALVTNKPEAFIAPLLEHFGLASFFGLWLGGDSLSRKKPDPLPLLHAAKHFGVDAETCLMVGDSRHDIEAGQAAGFRTLAVSYGYNHGEPIAHSQPDLVVESLRQVF
ncbi:phosphoglycolate phosphatase [Pistricoccus aurantiacus]|uniref:phosphoglycolate phosphatase n=1 Tax=Pistricoccus aurantiacus TaxID=1883414 RepID=UPI00362A59BA